jgi:ion channel-forming bestrophin family protein
MIIYISVYSLIVIYLMKHYLPEHLIAYDKNLSIMHSLLGFVISMLLVFRTNTAYDRWWEGRKVWGSLINTSRNLFIKFTYIIHDKEKTNQLNSYVVEFAHALKSHLRRNKKDIIPAKTKHLPMDVTSKLYKEVCALHNHKNINETQLLILNNDLQLLMDYTGMCERIRNTPIPFIYSMFIKKFIFFYVMTLPFAFAFNLSYAGIPVSAFIFYVLASLETIAEEIEDPFGIDSNDLPLDVYVNTIEKSREEMGNI